MRALLVLLLLLTWPAAAAWRKIDCPQVDLPPSETYDLVKQLAGFETGDDGLTVNQGGQQAAGKPTIDATGGRDGQPALRVDYKFAGDKPIEYLELGTPFTLEKPVTAIGIWFKQTGGPLRLKVRLRDPSGETHQIPMSRTSGDGWQFTAARLDAVEGHWGGDDDGKIQYPCRLYSVLADKPRGGFSEAGTIWFDDLAILRDKPRQGKLTVEVDDPALGLLYEPGQSLDVRLSGGTGYRWKVVDEAGNPRQQGAGSTVTIELPDPGYYALVVELLQGDQVIESRFLACAALVPRDPSIRNDFVGVQCHFRNNNYPLTCQDLLVRYGFTHFRDEISWSGAETKPGQIRLPEYGRTFVDSAHAKGLEPLLILDYGNPLYEAGGFPSTAATRAAYANYGAQMAKLLKGKVKAYEIWNEWSGGCGMAGKPRTNTPENYGLLLQAAYQAIKAADPNLTVVGIGGDHSAHHLEQYLGMMRAAGPHSMDAWSVHSYRYPNSPEASDLVGELNHAAGEAAKLGVTQPIWLTEIGWPTQTDPRGVTELTEARYLVRCFVLLQSTGQVDRVYWYDFKDDGLKRTYNENNFGIIHHQTYALAPKPAAVAMSVFGRLTAGAKFVELTVKDEAYSARYALPDGQELLIAWSTGADHSAKLTGRDVKRYALMGQALAADAPVALTESAQYVIGTGLRLEL